MSKSQRQLELPSCDRVVRRRLIIDGWECVDMPEFRCGVCDRLHDHLPRDIGYRRPDAVLDMPAEERERRVYEDDDLCTIDSDTFMLRGILYTPIDDGGQFGWGVWVTVSENDYYGYLDAWDNDAEDETPPFVGRIANEIVPYPGSRGLDVTVKPRSGGQRPQLTVISDVHPLGVDQRRGITVEKSHRLVSHFS
jgi:hypothetical protein